jgi:hypothetical protein
MSNIKSKLLVAAAFVTGSVGFSSSAFAGEGGVAGAASFQLTTGVVTQASVAVAVGKSTAYAGATTSSGTGTGTEAFAAGTSGLVTILEESIYLESINADTNLTAAQTNDLTANDININAINGTVAVDN